MVLHQHQHGDLLIDLEMERPPLKGITGHVPLLHPP